MKTTRYLLAVVAVCAIAASARAATYYVDATGGTDTNDGLSQGTAWKTVAKVNGSTFSAGDQVLFKRARFGMKSLVPLPVERRGILLCLTLMVRERRRR